MVMIVLYNLLLPFILALARVATLFNVKLRRGLNGRRQLIPETTQHYRSHTIGTPRILVHVASFGELEQAKPVIDALRTRYADAHIHLTFFSPSGYDHAMGKYRGAD